MDRNINLFQVSENSKKPISEVTFKLNILRGASGKEPLSERKVLKEFLDKYWKEKTIEENLISFILGYNSEAINYMFKITFSQYIKAFDALEASTKGAG